MNNINSRLDSIVRISHHVHIGGKRIHPYLLLFDTGVIATCVFLYIFTRIFTELDFLKLLTVYLLLHVSYEHLFLKIKRKVLKISSRSYLQDSVLYIIPMYLLGIWLTDLPTAASLDWLGLMFALLIGFTRVGCFLGGCCYGVPSRYGVRYPDEIFQPYNGTCQQFSPGPNPHCRVFPIQLVEALVNFFLLGGLLALVVYFPSTRGLILPCYFLCYSGFRFLGDFFRRSSVRPRHGRLTEAQWTAILFMLLSVIWLGVGLRLYPSRVSRGSAVGLPCSSLTADRGGADEPGRSVMRPLRQLLQT